MPVLHDALDRSFQLAAAMDARGYGRQAGVPAADPPRHQRADARRAARALHRRVRRARRHHAARPRRARCSCSVSAARPARSGSAGGAFTRTRYRPDPWLLAEWGTVACGAAVAVAMIVANHLDPARSNRRSCPPRGRRLPLLPVVGIAIAALPALFTPPPPLAHARGPRVDVDRARSRKWRHDPLRTRHDHLPRRRRARRCATSTSRSPRVSCASSSAAPARASRRCWARSTDSCRTSPAANCKAASRSTVATPEPIRRANWPTSSASSAKTRSRAASPTRSKKNSRTGWSSSRSRPT